MSKKPEVWKEVTDEYNGRQISGTYSESEGMGTVEAFGGRKSTQLGSSPAESLARIMLRELAQESRRFLN